MGWGKCNTHSYGNLQLQENYLSPVSKKLYIYRTYSDCIATYESLVNTMSCTGECQNIAVDMCWRPTCQWYLRLSS